jgi:hypothetical protein
VQYHHISRNDVCGDALPTGSIELLGVLSRHVKSPAELALRLGIRRAHRDVGFDSERRRGQRLVAGAGEAKTKKAQTY